MTADKIKGLLWTAIDGYANAKATSHPSEDAWRRTIAQGLELFENATRQDAEHAAVIAVTSKAGVHA